MEITEAQIEYAKNKLKKQDSIPAVAGSLMQCTPDQAEFSDLVAIANRARMELREEQDESDSDTTTEKEEESNEAEDTTRGSSSKNSASTEQEETSPEDNQVQDPPSEDGSLLLNFEDIDDLDDGQGEDSWEA